MGYERHFYDIKNIYWWIPLTGLDPICSIREYGGLSENLKFKNFLDQNNGVWQWKNIQKIKSVKPLRNERLLVMFQNNIKKIYDCNHLLKEEVFGRLKNDFLFKSAKVDQGCYGVIWNDEIDLSESEIQRIV